MAFLLNKLGTPRPPFVAALAVTVLLGGMVFAERAGWFSLPVPSDDLVGAVLPGAVVALTNEERKDSGLGSLKASALLNKAAQMKADDMAAKSYYAHVSPDGTIPPFWLNKVGYKYQAMGENLVVDRENSEQVVSAWMGSQYHRENILNPQFTEIGIGVAYGSYKGRDTIYVVQMLARPQQAAATPRVTVQPTPTPVRPQPITPVPTRTAATTSVLVRPPAPKPVVRDTVTPILTSVRENISTTTLAEVPSIVSDITLNESPVTPPFTTEPIELSPAIPVETPRISVRTKFRSFVHTVSLQMRSFFSPIF